MQRFFFPSHIDFDFRRYSGVWTIFCMFSNVRQWMLWIWKIQKQKRGVPSALFFLFLTFFQIQNIYFFKHLLFRNIYFFPMQNIVFFQIKKNLFFQIKKIYFFKSKKLIFSNFKHLFFSNFKHFFFSSLNTFTNHLKSKEYRWQVKVDVV